MAQTKKRGPTLRQREVRALERIAEGGLERNRLLFNHLNCIQSQLAAIKESLVIMQGPFNYHERDAPARKVLVVRRG